MVVQEKLAFLRPILLVLGSLTLGQLASAEEGVTAPEVDQPSKWRISATNSTALIYSGNNRDTRLAELETFLNDDWGALQNRLTLQADRGKWSLSLRVDGSWFYARPDPVKVGLDSVILREQEPPAPGAPDDPTF
ncbi:MAG: hypothetical protein MK135_15195, partial [Polyangiaceae bacterium]|nr:hypothetical protein [Polyangiaceae bacterium]